MGTAAKIEGLCKNYPKFKLKDISFEIEEGSIMGLIGRNGAGKTTTIKAMLNLIHPSAGKIEYFGMNLAESESEIKKMIGYAGGAVDYYRKKKIRKIVEVTKTFYPGWNDAEYEKYLRVFNLDEEKTPSELSEGMKVKLNLAIALSHGAKLLILDEPTSGLDPVSREELLEVFRYLKEQGVAVLFSTHITSDLDKCADYITYIHEGKILATGKMKDFISESMEKGRGNSLEEIMINYEKEAFHERLAE